MPDDELEELFPDLQQALSNWTPPGTNGDQTPPEHAGVTDEQVEQWIQSQGGRVGPSPEISGQSGRPPQFAPNQGISPPTGGVEDSTQGSPQPGEIIPPQPVDIPEEIQFGDQRIPRSRIEAYERFNEVVQSDERLRGLLDSYLRTGRVPPELVGGADAPPSPQSAPPTPPTRPEPPPPPQAPPGLDLEDPAIRTLWERQQQLEQTLSERIDSVNQGLNRTTSLQESQAQAQHEAIVNRGMRSFQQQYGLNDDETRSVHDAAARLNVLPSLLSGIDPVTGAPTRPDPLAAVERAFEIAYYMMPNFRNKAFRGWAENQVKDQERKRKLGALSGSSGSVPRTQPAPTSPEQRQESLRREVAEMFAGTWSAPE